MKIIIQINIFNIISILLFNLRDLVLNLPWADCLSLLPRTKQTVLSINTLWVARSVVFISLNDELPELIIIIIMMIFYCLYVLYSHNF